MEQKSNGALIGSFIIVIILIIGGLYFWQTTVKEKIAPVNSNTNINEPDSTVNIEKDLNNINLNNLDKAI